MVSGFLTSPNDHARICSGLASPIRIASKLLTSSKFIQSSAGIARETPGAGKNAKRVRPLGPTPAFRLKSRGAQTSRVSRQPQSVKVNPLEVVLGTGGGLFLLGLDLGLVLFLFELVALVGVLFFRRRSTFLDHVGFGEILAERGDAAEDRLG